MKLASIEKIKEIFPHPNADKLEQTTVLGDNIILQKGMFKVGEYVAFIYPDSILPDKEWTAFYKAKSSRVRAIKLRGVFSMGIVEKLDKVGYAGPIKEGLDITEALGITKYIEKEPSDYSAKGKLPFGIPETNETRANKLKNLPYGELVDVLFKVDGSSGSFYYHKSGQKGVCGRTQEYRIIDTKGKERLEGIKKWLREHVHSYFLRMFFLIRWVKGIGNNHTRLEKKYSILEKLKAYSEKHNISICLRGEVFGAGVQKGDHNPHSKLASDVAFFSVYLIDERRYARKNDPHYFVNVCKELGLPMVPMIEENVILTKELIEKYDSELEKLNNQGFEGVVINTDKDSFKIINKHYDAEKE